MLLHGRDLGRFNQCTIFKMPSTPRQPYFFFLRNQLHKLEIVRNHYSFPLKSCLYDSNIFFSSTRGEVNLQA